MININKILETSLNTLFYLGLIFIFSCGELKQDKKVVESNISNTSKNDSLINAVFNYAKQYFDIQSIDSIIAQNGSPINRYKTQWCGGICDDSLLTTFEYSGLIFNFFEHNNSNIELESILFSDKRISLPANLTIGKTTRYDILQSLGLPQDTYHYNTNRTVTKSSDTTQLGGGTATFTYTINIDEYAISLSMTKDTLRKIEWVKNMN